jgi:hypothetical protein
MKLIISELIPPRNASFETQDLTAVVEGLFHYLRAEVISAHAGSHALAGGLTVPSGRNVIYARIRAIVITAHAGSLALS